MQYKIVDSADDSPNNGKFRADDSLNIARKVGIIPQPYLEEFQAYDTRYIFDGSHANRHNEQQKDMIPHRVFYDVPPFKPCHQIQNAEAESV